MKTLEKIMIIIERRLDLCDLLYKAHKKDSKEWHYWMGMYNGLELLIHDLPLLFGEVTEK